MPWHVGGDERLTYDEIEAFIDDFKARQQARKKAANEA